MNAKRRVVVILVLVSNNFLFGNSSDSSAKRTNFYFRVGLIVNRASPVLTGRALFYNPYNAVIEPPDEKYRVKTGLNFGVSASFKEGDPQRKNFPEFGVALLLSQAKYKVNFSRDAVTPSTKSLTTITSKDTYLLLNYEIGVKRKINTRWVMRHTFVLCQNLLTSQRRTGKSVYNQSDPRLGKGGGTGIVVVVDVDERQNNFKWNYAGGIFYRLSVSYKCRLIKKPCEVLLFRNLNIGLSRLRAPWWGFCVVSNL